MNNVGKMSFWDRLMDRWWRFDLHPWLFFGVFGAASLGGYFAGRFIMYGVVGVMGW